jgi:hypothetical protein
MLFPGGHAASICDNTPEAICRVLEGEEGLSLLTHRPVTTKNTGKYDSIGDKKENSMCTHKISYL